MYSVSPATQTLCTPPYSGSYQATSLGCSRSVTSTTCKRPYAREGRPSNRSPADSSPKTSSATKTYWPCRQAVWVPRMNPGPLVSATCLYSLSRSYLNWETSWGFDGLPPLTPFPTSRITSPSSHQLAYTSPSCTSTSCSTRPASALGVFQRPTSLG